MAAYKTEQINVGSIAAPDIGKDLINLGSTLRDNFQTGVANTRNAIADQRAKELFDRQTNEYNREVGLRKAKQDITRDFMNNQSAYGGQPLHDRLNDAVNAEAQRRLTSTPEIGELDALVARQNKGETLTPQELVRKDEIAKKITFSPEEASGIQKESESIVPFQEDAKAMLAAKYAAAGIDNAHALATDATSGLVSRATIQERMDKNREIAQQWNDKVAQANLEAYKLNNQNAVTNAKEQNDINRSLISSGTGGGAGGGSGSYKGGGLLPYTATVNDLNNHISGLGISPSWLYANDERDARKLAGQYDKYTPQQLAYAMDNSIKIGSLGDKYIDQGTFTSKLAEMTPGQMVSSNPYGTGIRTATQVTGQVDPKDLLSSFVPRDIAGYDTKDMDTRIAKNLPFLHAGQPEVPTNGVVERTILSKPQSQVQDTKVPTATTDRTKEVPVNGTMQEKTGYIETGNSKNPYQEHSTKYLGRYQFDPKTLEEYKGKGGIPKDFTTEEFLNNPKLQDQVFAEHMKTIDNRLNNNGYQANDMNRWIVHNLGMGNFEKIQAGKLDDPGLINAIKNQLPTKNPIEPTVGNYLQYYKNMAGNTADFKDSTGLVKTKTDAESKLQDITDRRNAIVSKIQTSGATPELAAQLRNNSVEYGKVRNELQTATADVGKYQAEQQGLVNKAMEHNYTPEKIQGDYLRADSAYKALANQPEGTKIGGLTRAEWYEKRSRLDKIGDNAWVAPIVAATAPLVLAAGVPGGISTIEAAGPEVPEALSGLSGRALEDAGKELMTKVAKQTADKAAKQVAQKEALKNQQNMVTENIRTLLRKDGTPPRPGSQERIDYDNLEGIWLRLQQQLKNLK